MNTMKLPNRYLRNHSLISEDEQELLRTKSAAIVGGGGLGGHLAEQLARLGIGRVIVIDGDVFEESNLNRQRFSTESRLGLGKAECIKNELKDVNSEVEVISHQTWIDGSNGLQLLKDADVVMDGTDNIPTRLLLQRLCEELRIPLIHGAIGGWFGQVCVVMPGDRTLSRLYPNEEMTGVEKHLGNPPFIPALVASLQVAEFIKLIFGKGELIRNSILYVDTLNNQTIKIDI